MKKNIIFFAKLILALLPLIGIVLYTLLFPMGYMDREYPAWKYTKDVCAGKLNPISEDEGGKDSSSGEAGNGSQDSSSGEAGKGSQGSSSLEAGKLSSTLILGDSRAMADLDPKGFASKDVVNLAIGGGTSIEMYYSLNNYLKNVGTPKKAIIMFAPFHYSVIDNFNERTLYFNYLSIEEMKELYDLAKAAGSETVCQKGYLDEFFNARLRTPMKYLPALINARLFTRYNENVGIYNELIEKRGHDQFGELEGCSDLNYETTYSKMHRTGDAALLDIYFKKLLDLCKEEGIEVTVLIPPMNQSSYENLHYMYYKDFTSYMNEYVKAYPEFTINPGIMPMDDKYFGDASHLNKEGAKFFTYIVSESTGY